MENVKKIGYDAKIEIEKGKILEKFYDALACQGVDLKKIDKLVIRDVGIFFRYIRIVGLKDNKVIFDNMERKDERLLDVLYKHHHIIEEEIGLKIKRGGFYRRQLLIPTIFYEWELDCTGLK